MEKKYAKERNILILIALLKEFKIKKVVASPGTTNLSLVASLQNDPFFEMYSCVDERSAAYMACGLAAETGEAVIITCTGATASRNYVSALTEAYYRKLPILAITGTQSTNRIGQLQSQLIDRSRLQNDIVKLSVEVPAVRDDEEAHDVMVSINKALNELFRNGGGPVHINLRTKYTRDFSVAELPHVQTIKRIDYSNIDSFPEMTEGRIGIFVGSHNTFTPSLTEAVDRFCASRNAVVFCDHTSGYYGRYKVNFSIVASQKQYSCPLLKLDLCIHLGEISAEYGTLERLDHGQEVWRVSPDGEIRDQFFELRYIFALNEEDFFNYYTIKGTEVEDGYYKECIQECEEVQSLIPDDIPFSNIWVAKTTSPRLPFGSSIHFGILNSTRSWNFFRLPDGITSFANVGGFGIDGGVSSLIGASLANPQKLYFGVVGDLAFFYDMNVLGNRHVGNNIRLLIINNGKGVEFKNFYHPGALFGDDADRYIAAGGHFGAQSKSLVHNYAIDLGFEYMTASSKEDYFSVVDRFVSQEKYEKSIVLEIFTRDKDESDALKLLWGLKTDSEGINKARKAQIKNKLRGIIGKKGIAFLKALKGQK